MIVLKHRTPFESIRRFFSKKYREKQDAELEAAIRLLVANPDVTCMIGGEVCQTPKGTTNERH